MKRKTKEEIIKLVKEAQDFSAQKQTPQYSLHQINLICFELLRLLEK